MDDFDLLLLEIELAIKHGRHNQATHGRKTGRRAAYASAYSTARGGGSSVSEARAKAREESLSFAQAERAQRQQQRTERMQSRADHLRKLAADGKLTEAQARRALQRAENLEARVRGEAVPNRKARNTANPQIQAAEKATEERLRSMSSFQAARQIPFELEGSRVALQRHDNAMDNFDTAIRQARQRAASASDEATRKRAVAEIDAVERDARTYIQTNKRTLDETRFAYDTAKKELNDISRDFDRNARHYNEGPSDYIIRLTASADARAEFVARMEREMNNFIRRMNDTANI